MDAIAEQAVGKLQHFNMQELANTAWAMATLQIWYQEPLLHAIALPVCRRWSDDTPWQPFFDCVDVFSLDSQVKGRVRGPVQAFARRAYSSIGQASSRQP
mmetsp:Transcript_51204/g.83053  ORF Transcript_51204/g.83053 Transcript_51204/m.83053 type:complete len:100 (-) Transcript_51204:61-360(-)